MADYSFQQSSGGQKTNTVAASSTGDVVVSSKPGRICKIVITTAGSASLELYDHASASSGATMVWKSPATTVLGETYTVNIPVANGIIGKRQSNTPAYTVSYTEDKVAGGGANHKNFLYSEGGQYTSAHAAGSGGASAALTGKGMLAQVVVLAQGSAVTDIYDNTAASGTKLFSVPASGTTAVAIGTVYTVQMPVATGIYVGGTTNTSQLLICYSKNNARGL